MLLIASLLLVPAVVAHGQATDGTIEVAPNVAGRASELRVDFRPTPQQNEQARNAQALVIAATRGFKIDPRSRKRRCSEERARQFDCPEASRIGDGEANGTASIAGGTQTFTASIDVFLARPWQPGDIAGVVVQFREPQSGERGQARGRLVRVPTGPFGAEVRFEDLAGATPSVPGVTITVDRIQLRVGARRKVVRIIRRNGRRIRRVRRYTLIRNPRTCAGSWPYQVRVRYPDREEVRDGSLACASR
jgi:hypothetical protein